VETTITKTNLGSLDRDEGYIEERDTPLKPKKKSASSDQSSGFLGLFKRDKMIVKDVFNQKEIAELTIVGGGIKLTFLEDCFRTKKELVSFHCPEDGEIRKSSDLPYGKNKEDAKKEHLTFFYLGVRGHVGKINIFRG